MCQTMHSAPATARPSAHGSPVSSSLDDECHAEPTFADSSEFYCCIFSSVPIKRGAVIVCILTAVQLIVHFFVFLLGCGVTLAHVVLAILPIVVGSVVVSLTFYGIKINDGICLRPFLVYQICGVFLFSALLAIHLLRHLTGNDALSTALWLYEERLFDDNAFNETYEKIGFGIYLLGNLAINLVSLQVGFGCYTYLENYRQFLFSDITDV